MVTPSELILLGHCRASVNELHNGLEMLLSLSKDKIDVANIILQANREQLLLYSASTITRRWYCNTLFCFNYHLQYFVLCV